MKQIITALFLIILSLGAAASETQQKQEKKPPEGELHLSHDAVNAAQPGEAANLDALAPELTLKLQVLLDRAHFSPGEIDGHMGDNTVKAFEAFERASGFSDGHQITADAWRKLVALGEKSGDASQAQSLLKIAAAKDEVSKDDKKDASAPDMAAQQAGGSKDAVIQVLITEDDLRGPFARSISQSLKAQSHLRRLAYRNPGEALGERYHSSPALLHALNPGVSFHKRDQPIWAPNIHSLKPEGKLARVIADKKYATVTAQGEDGQALAIYPATIGSAEKPTPDGSTEAQLVARNPWYTYDPRLVHFKEVKTRTKFRIAPGPHNPVGLVWIELAKKGYGIHGAPDPSKVSKTSSHGCVRLTNWDALELAALVEPGTPVDFISGGEPEAAGAKPGGNPSQKPSAAGDHAPGAEARAPAPDGQQKRGQTASELSGGAR